MPDVRVARPLLEDTSMTDTNTLTNAIEPMIDASLHRCSGCATGTAVPCSACSTALISLQGVRQEIRMLASQNRIGWINS